MTLDDICKVVAKELNEDISVVKKIAQYQFEFTKQVMKDKDDIHNILFNKLFKFKLKRRYYENKHLEYKAR